METILVIKILYLGQKEIHDFTNLINEVYFPCLIQHAWCQGLVTCVSVTTSQASSMLLFFFRSKPAQDSICVQIYEANIPEFQYSQTAR